MYEDFLQLIRQKYSEADQKLIGRALDFAEKYHGEQKRASGESYIIHPVAAATTLINMRLDAQTVSAALLHDVVDDTPVTLEDIKKEFGDEIAFLVEGVSKLGKVRYPKEKVEIAPIEARAEEPIDPRMENLRRMLVATAQDLRVLFIKLADRLHNMQTLQFLPEEKQKRIALETLEIFAPLAYRLGMWEMRSQLEDLAFPHIYSKEYYWLLLNVRERYEERKAYLARIQPTVERLMKENGINAIVVNSRAKHYWSLYQKLLRYDMDFDQIHDLVALRIILNSVEECYRVLGILHLKWKPLPGKIKDYIALPKPNGYQSIHTTVYCEEGKITEFQIRTAQMNETAEFGVAAHWAYKEQIATPKQLRQYAWIRQLSEWQKQIRGTKEFFESLKIELFKDRIFVFTPKGDIVDLPEGATPVDFAYAIHSELGDHCTGAKVNGKMVSLDTSLENGAQIEILIVKTRHPSRDWLDFVKTTVAKNHIRQWLRAQSDEQNLIRGREIIDRELKMLKQSSWDEIPEDKKLLLVKNFSLKDINSILVAIGAGDISGREIIKTLYKEEEILQQAPQKMVPRLDAVSPNVAVAGASGISFRIAKCCEAKSGDAIVAFITKNRGAAIHLKTCENILEKKVVAPDRIVQASWDVSPKCYLAKIKIACNDRIGLLRDIAACTSKLAINILGSQAIAPDIKKSQDEACVIIDVELPNIEKLESLFKALGEIDGVRRVEKIK